MPLGYHLLINLSSAGRTQQICIHFGNMQGILVHVESPDYRNWHLDLAG